MGDRAQVKIGDVYLYTHWGGSSLVGTVQKAIQRMWRWKDPEYLTRIIFEEMISSSTDKETGFGIGSTLHSDIWRVVEVITNHRWETGVSRVTVRDLEKVTIRASFEDFCRMRLTADGMNNGLYPTFMTSKGGTPLEKVLWAQVRPNDVVWIYTEENGKKTTSLPMDVIDPRLRKLKTMISDQVITHMTEDLYKKKVEHGS